MEDTGCLEKSQRKGKSISFDWKKGGYIRSAEKCICAGMPEIGRSVISVSGMPRTMYAVMSI
jgi:hypothetical protein